MALHVLRAAAVADDGDPVPKLRDELLHPIAVGFEKRVARVDVRVENVHHHPQQSVLQPQAGQRQTACMRYISSPHRSQSVLSTFGELRSTLSGVDGSTAGAALSGVRGRAGVFGGVGSAMRRIMARQMERRTRWTVTSKAERRQPRRHRRWGCPPSPRLRRVRRSSPELAGERRLEGPNAE